MHGFEPRFRDSKSLVLPLDDTGREARAASVQRPAAPSSAILALYRPGLSQPFFRPAEPAGRLVVWGGTVAFLIDRRPMAAVTTLVACAVLAFFGFIHSITPTGGIYFPWRTGSILPYHWTAAYLAFALLIFGLSRTQAYRDSPALAH